MKIPRLTPVTLLLGLVGALTAGVVLLGLVALVLTPTLPSVENLKDLRLQTPLRVYSADGALLAEYGEERRIPTRIGDVPPLLLKAILAVEDESFYFHQGVDFLGIARAALANLRSRGIEQGASTITMQVARNYFLTREKTYTRKLREILLAFKIERNLDKNQIFELYINKIFLGHRAYGFGAAAQVYYGKALNELTLPEMAMLAALPKAPSRDNPLTNPDNALNRRNHVLKRMLKLGYLDEAAYKQAVAAPQTASRHLPTVDTDAPYIGEMVRQHMVETYGETAYTEGYRVYTTVSAKQQQAADQALRRGLLDYSRRHGYRGPAGRTKIETHTGKDRLDEVLADYPFVGGLVPAVVLQIEHQSVGAYTREGAVAQLNWTGLSWARKYAGEEGVGAAPGQAADVVRVGDIVYLERLEDGWRLAQVPKVAGALVALRPQDGAILALAGGFDYYDSKFNRALQAERQPGSSIKPFIYSAALEKGFSPATTVSGAPIVVHDVSLEDEWRPENFSKKFVGPTRLREALAQSLNLVSVRVMRAITPEFAVEHLARFGFDQEKLPPNLSLALGSASLSPVNMARAFAVFANGGYRVEPYVIERVETADGRVLTRANPTRVCPTCAEQEAAADAPRSAPRAISGENAFLITSMMRDVVNSGTAKRALELGRHDLAGKTGTTNDHRDAWFSGFNADLVTTVWVGFDQPAPLGKTEVGGVTALPVWMDFMRVALDGVAEKPLTPPAGITTAFVNRDTGQLTTAADPDGYVEYFLAGTRPGETTVAEQPAAAGVPTPRAEKIPEGLF